MICSLCGTHYTDNKCSNCGLHSAANPIVYPLGFGKYKGMTIEDVYNIAPGYLPWMIRSEYGSPAQKAQARMLLKGTDRAAINKPNNLKVPTHLATYTQQYASKSFINTPVQPSVASPSPFVMR